MQVRLVGSELRRNDVQRRQRGTEVPMPEVRVSHNEFAYYGIIDDSLPVVLFLPSDACDWVTSQLKHVRAVYDVPTGDGFITLTDSLLSPTAEMRVPLLKATRA